MKRKVFWTALAVSFMLAAAAFVTGCSDDGDAGGTYAENGSGYSGGYNSGEAKDVTIKAMAEFNLFRNKTSTAGRSLLPDSTTANDYNFYLCYEDSSGNKAIKQPSFTAGTDPTTGTYNVQLTKDVYKMTLYAVLKTSTATIVTTGTGAEDSVKAAAALRSYAVVDMNYQNTVSFLLSPSGLTGKGTYDIEIEAADDFDVPLTGYEITAGLYYAEGEHVDDLVTGTDVKLKPKSDAAKNKGVFDSASGANKLAMPAGGVDCGRYNVKVLFKATGSTKTYTYAEDVVIQANQKTEAIRAKMPPDGHGPVIVPGLPPAAGTPPKAPQHFIAGYKPPVGKRSGVYTVEFAWADTSNCEDGFEIDLMRVDDDRDATGKITSPTYPVMPTKESEWNTLKGAYCKDADKVFDSTHYTDDTKVLDGVYAWRNDGPEGVQLITLNSKNLPSFMASMADGDKGGSLAANSKNLMIELPLAHRYVARIRAVNEGGASAYAYLTLPSAAGALKIDAITTADSLTALDDKDKPISYKADQAFVGFSVFTASTQFEENVKTLNLYRISYDVAGGEFRSLVASGLETAVTENPVLLSFHSQHVASTGGVSADHVELLTPNTKILDTNANPQVAEILGKENPSEASGIAGTTKKRLELKSAMGNGFWQCWSYGSADGDDHYPQKAATAQQPVGDNELYTGYDNLDLFATYEASGDDMLHGNIVLNLIQTYDIKPEYVTMNLYANGGAASDYSLQIGQKKNPSDPDNFKDGAKLSDFNRTSPITVPRGTAADEVVSIGFTVQATAATTSGTGTGTGSSGATGSGGTGGSGTGSSGSGTGSSGGSTSTTPAKTKFSYDKIRVEVYNSTGSFVVARESTESGPSKTVKFKLPSRDDKYVVHIWGFKGAYQLEVAHPMTLNVK